MKPTPHMTSILAALALLLAAACDGGGTSGTGVITASSDLEAGSPVCGTVTDGAGQPIAQVTVVSTVRREEATTDGDGQFILDVAAEDDGTEIVVVDFDGAAVSDAVVDVQPCE